MPTILILPPRRVKIIWTLLTSRSSRAPSHLTSIAHLPRNVTTSNELSRRSLFALSTYTTAPRINTLPNVSVDLCAKFREPEFPFGPIAIQTRRYTVWISSSVRRTCVIRICLRYAQIPKMDRANSERERIDGKSTNDLQRSRSERAAFSIKLSHSYTNV